MKLRKIVYTVEVLHDEDEGTVTERWTRDGELDREGGPAFLTRHVASGTVIREQWFKRGAHGRRGGPAQIHRDPETGIATFEMWSEAFDGNPNRKTGPAIIQRDKATGAITKAHWFRNGRAVNVARSVRAAFMQVHQPKA